MANAVARLSHVHEMVLNWLVLNPDKSMRECADHFGYTQPWLSRLVHSDLFQAELFKRQSDIANRVAGSIPDKLRAACDVALDKLGDKIAASEDPDFILEAADKTLHRLGYAPASARNPAGSPGAQGQGALLQNNFFISSADLADAREIIRGQATRIESTDAAEIAEPVALEQLPEDSVK